MTYTSGILVSILAQLIGCSRSEWLSVALPQAQLTAVAIIPTRAACWRLVSCGSLAAVGTAYDDNAIGGLVEDNAHGCDDKQACVAHRAAMPSLWRSAHSLFRSNNVWRYAATVELSSQFIATIAQARASHQPKSE